jgi:hypothetical protein
MQSVQGSTPKRRHGRVREPETDAMLFLLTNRTRPGLGAAQYAELARLARAFYADVPEGVALRGEWAALDRSANFSLVEAPDLETVQRMQAPFEPYVESTIVAVMAIRGWTAS